MTLYSVIDALLEFAFGKLGVLLHFGLRNRSVGVDQFGDARHLLGGVLELGGVPVCLVHFALDQSLVASAHHHSFTGSIHGFHIKLLVAGTLYFLERRFG